MLRVLADVIMRLFSLIIQGTSQPGEIPHDWRKGECHLGLQKEQEGGTGELQGSGTSLCMGQTLVEATSWHRKDKRVLGNVWHRITNSKPCDGPE